MTRWLAALTHRLAVMAGLASLEATPAADRGLLDGRPEAIVDLDSAEGLQAVRGEWRYAEAPAGAPGRRSAR